MRRVRLPSFRIERWYKRYEFRGLGRRRASEAFDRLPRFLAAA
jgi:hypothetical protein